MSKVSELENQYYHSNLGWKNGTKELHDHLNKIINIHGTDILEIGPGLSNPTSQYLSKKATNLDGLDIDERANENQWVNNVYIYEGREFPIADEQYDVIVADYVMEHVEHPEIMFKEVARVLRPEGAFVFRTPNIWHYVSLISRFTPHWVHVRTAYAARATENHEADPYPTFYRANSRSSVRRLAAEHGLLVEFHMVEKEPSYLRFHPLAYRLGVAYERSVNSIQVLAGLRVNIFAVLKKSIN